MSNNNAAGFGSNPAWTAEQRRQRISQLAADPPLLNRVAQLWLGRVEDPADVADVPPLEAEVATRLRQRVLTEIRRGDLSAEALRLATSGFSAVAYALLRPLLTINLEPKE